MTEFLKTSTDLKHQLVRHVKSNVLEGYVQDYKRGNTTKNVRLLKINDNAPKTIYQFKTNLNGGDFVVLNGQIEATNDLHVLLTDTVRKTTFNDCKKSNVLFAIRIIVKDSDKNITQISPWATINITPDMHHCPLYSNATYYSPKSGSYTFEIQAQAKLSEVQAATCNRYPHLSIENGKYGQLTGNVYREM